MDFDNRTNEVLGRAALTMYHKQCVGDLIARREATMRFTEIVKQSVYPTTSSGNSNGF